MLTYYLLLKNIESIEEKIKENNYKEAIETIIILKEIFIEFLENFWEILEDAENKRLSLPIYKILFRVVSELALDIDILYVNVIQDGKLRKSRLSIALEKLNLNKEIEWFASANDIIFDMMNFIEYYYEAPPGTEFYSLPREELKKNIEDLKRKLPIA